MIYSSKTKWTREGHKMAKRSKCSGTCFLGFVAFGLALQAGAAQATEVSLLSGVYQSESNTLADKDAGKKSTISVGGRVADQLGGSPQLCWFGQGNLTLKSYSKGDYPAAPSDSTGLRIGGGLRYYFGKLSENVSPFVYGLGEYRDDKDASFGATGYTETEESGLYYSGSFGIRLNLAQEYFCDLETPLFDSALFGDKKSVTTDAADKKTSKDETKSTDLWVNSTGAFSAVQVALGMRF